MILHQIVYINYSQLDYRSFTTQYTILCKSLGPSFLLFASTVEALSWFGAVGQPVVLGILSKLMELLKRESSILFLNAKPYGKCLIGNRFAFQHDSDPIKLPVH